MSDRWGSSKIRHWHVDLAGLALLCGLLIAVYVGQFRPLLHRREAAAGHARELIAGRTALRELHDQNDAAEKQLKSHRNAQAEHQLQLRPYSELNTRLGRVTELAESYGLRVDTLASEPQVQQGGYGTVLIRLSGRGGYRSCINLLRAMRTQMPEVAVVELDLSAATAGRETEATVNLALRWHTAPATRGTRQ